MNAPVRLVDTHSHVMTSAFDPDRPAVLARARAAGVEQQVCVGYSLATSRAALRLAAAEPGLHPTVGIHPNDAASASVADFDEVARLARTPGVVGIGETGLDYYRDRTPPNRQREALAWHLRLAESLGLPVVIHSRGDVEGDLAAALEISAARRTGGEAPGVLHCFSSTDREYLDRLLAAGYYVSFAGTLTYKNAADLRAMARHVPLDRLLVETDCPYLTPEPHRGKRNEPAHVRLTAERLATVMEVPLSALAVHLVENSRRLFPALAHTPTEADT